MSPADNMDNKLSQTYPWELLAEFLLPDDYAKNDQESENASKQLFQAGGDLGLAKAQLDRINKTLENATRNAIKHNVQKGSKGAITIRLYYQKKKSEQPDGGETLEVDFDALCLYNSGMEPSEVHCKAFEAETGETGWGYFLTERRVEAHDTSPGGTMYLIELFLYTEEK
jgi:hypothetical protein